MSFFKYSAYLVIMIFILSCSQDTDMLSTSYPTTDNTVSDVGDLKDLDNDGLAKWGRDLPIRVMTRNIYIGTDVDVILSAPDPTQIPVLTAQAFQEWQSTNFPERARSLAIEIALTRPDVIGLQEAFTIRLQSPGDAAIGGTVPAEKVLMNYLDIFMATLKAMGLDYKVAAKIQNFDVEIPMLTGINPQTFDDIRVTDYSAILVRKNVKVSNVLTKNYDFNLNIPNLGVSILRGFSAVDAKIHNRSYRVVNTHLEAFSSQIRLIQMNELLGTLADEDLPIIMTGDFNSEAPDSATYQYILANGFVDIWTKNLFKYNPDGFTYGHDSDLMNETADFTKRIDYIFVRNTPGSFFNVGFPVLAIVVGDEQFNRTPSGLWPSDHGGVVARFSIPNVPHYSKK